MWVVAQRECRKTRSIIRYPVLCKYSVEQIKRPVDRIEEDRRADLGVRWRKHIGIELIENQSIDCRYLDEVVPSDSDQCIHR